MAPGYRTQTFLTRQSLCKKIENLRYEQPFSILSCSEFCKTFLVWVVLIWHETLNIKQSLTQKDFISFGLVVQVLLNM